MEEIIRTKQIWLQNTKCDRSEVPKPHVALVVTTGGSVCFGRVSKGNEEVFHCT